MAGPVEINVPYSLAQDACYALLLQDVVPKLRIPYGVGYWGFKVPIGNVGFGLVRDDWRAFKLYTKIRYYYGPIEYNFGPLIEIYSRSTGPNTTMVEFVAESAAYSDWKILDIGYDVLTKKIPLYSWAVRKIQPDIYYGDDKVIDGDRLKVVSFTDDMGRRMLRAVFNGAHALLAKVVKEASR